MNPYPCPACGYPLNMDDEYPVSMLWEMVVFGVICRLCGAEIGVIHPEHQQVGQW